MDALPFKKPAVKALLDSISDETRKEFVSQMLLAAIAMETENDAVGFAAVILYRDGRRRLFWNTVRGSGFALEQAFKRCGQEIVKFTRTNEG